ncbi:tail fiber domain-containing protein [Streptococcus pneumoniae]|nr:PblB [Streptococcus pneumoniae MNZ14]MDG8791852.1 tail fiber domain-containing protein [Streptococcus pneumoniae]MDG8837495.1 tail fiber domain-containing protein [Streptococcus pneumoniae]MDG9285791.1 tail fiber domain-containing protein [Streptococcus pneumoniae]MDV8605550.1 tail fiber domain-containing protein [Streptococcus pneumoniae]
MDALTRRQFDRAMFAKERTLAIRVGEYASRDIKEASFEYGYIKGDTYKPGGTCAGSGKITFTSIITTFNKLDTLHPEIGLLVGDTYQWVKMGEYFINDIEIDRNRNTTTLELMDGMFKLNREYVTDLHFPAEVREVIQEICLKTGIELANDYFGISAMRYHIEQVPEGKKFSFRDMLSAMTQMIGMSCFFNREGKMEIRDLTESNITINADSYFLHGLTKSEIEYQIAGITCKTDKKSLTVGMKTGRSLELDNVFMTQSALNDLYYKLKNLTYYPYNLNYQGHLLLEVGQWVTIQTNKKENFKVPVLSQSFTFKGGLRGRISADSKAGNDTQYSYEGTITKQIKQQDGIEAKIQAQIEAADAAFDAEFDKREKAITDAIELGKARAEEVKRELSDTINQRFNSFDNGPLKETKRKAEEALRNAGASTLLAQEAKRIGLDSVARLEAFKSQTTSAQTALSGDLDALKQTVTSEVNQASEYRRTTTEVLSRMTGQMNGFATKSEVRQDVAGLTETFAKLKTDTNNLISGAKSEITLAKTEFQKTADGLSAKMSAVERYVNQDGQRQEALQRYTREESARQATAVRELVNRDFVGKATYQEDVKGINQRLEAVKTSANKDIASQIASYRQSVDGKFTDISSQITTYKQDVGGQISGLSNRLTSSEQGTTTQISNLSNRINSNKQGTDNQISNLKTQVATNKANADSQFANVTNQLARKVETTDFQRVKETSKLYERILGNSKNGIANTIARMAMTHQLFQVEVSKNDHLKTVQRQLAGSWSVQNINSAGDLISGINLGANGHNRFVGKLTHITGETLIDRAVIKSAMVDKLKTGNFEAGSVTTTILAAEAVTAEKVRFDAAFIRKMTANDAFIDQLTSKRIFSTKVESVISSSTFLEAYQGRIGGFTIGRFAQGRGRWISGINQFSVGMGNGEGGGYNGENTAFWANWGYSWNSPGPNAWYVTTSGNMYCRNGADFHGKVDFSNSSRANFYGNTTFSRSPVFSNGIELGSKDVFGDGWNPKGGRNAVVWWNQVGSGSVKYWMEQKSDRRLKENITDTAVKALDKINRLRMVAFDFIESKKHEEIGLIAQEVETIVPRIVSRDPENPDGYLHIDYTALVPYLIKAIQELNQKIEKMEKTIA